MDLDLSTCLTYQLVPYSRPSGLRSLDQNKLKVPTYNLKTAGAKAFSTGAAELWNALPAFIRQSKSYNSFRTSLKTHYFKLAYD